ncbi:hypothetical protein M3Y99_00750100 [Aphelenchoides fujianensis]|nr:hypothetical protein M3Y99_00750100 [Aphelenchoides fujianensis]
MYAFLLVLLIPTIAAVPLDANEWSYREIQPCIANETAHHVNITAETNPQIEAICSAKAGYGDFVLLANTAVFEAVHGKKEYDDECLKALTGLKWKKDPRLNASIPLSKENRKNVCT